MNTEQSHVDEDSEVIQPPKKSSGATRKAARKSNVNLALDSKRLNMELDRMKYEQELRLKRMEIELAQINVGD